MDDLLHTQKEVLKLLYKNGIATFKAGSFSEAVKKGQIPYRTEKGSNRKWYNYNDVKNAIIKAGIGGVKPDTYKKLSTSKKLDMLKPPSNNENPIEYGSVAVKELGSDPTLTDVNIFKAIYTGKLEQLKYERESGQLVRKEDVENTAFIVARTIRDKILAIPERLSDELASINDSYVIKEMLYKEFNKLLEGFSEDSFL